MKWKPKEVEADENMRIEGQIEYFSKSIHVDNKEVKEALDKNIRGWLVVWGLQY